MCVCVRACGGGCRRSGSGCCTRSEIIRESVFSLALSDFRSSAIVGFCRNRCELLHCGCESHTYTQEAKVRGVLRSRTDLGGKGEGFLGPGVAGCYRFSKVEDDGKMNNGKGSSQR